MNGRFMRSIYISIGMTIVYYIFKACGLFGNTDTTVPSKEVNKIQQTPEYQVVKDLKSFYPSDSNQNNASTVNNTVTTNQ